MFSGGDSFGDPNLGLDSERFFSASTSSSGEVPCIHCMQCPAHSYGTYENAARKFLDNRYDIFSQNQYLLTLMWICQSNKPRAWYTFGALADVTVMNPILPVTAYKSDIEVSERFNQFFWLAQNAKKATAPGRFLASIHLIPARGAFFKQSTFGLEEIKFLTCCAIAGGARGIIYRQYRASSLSDQPGQNAFLQFNKELRLLRPLLMIAEPVSWASTADNGYIAKSLLCGDEAILVMVFDRRYFSEQKDGKVRTPVFGKCAKQVEIKVKVPAGFLVSEVKSLYNPLSEELWNYQENKLDFRVNMVDSVHVYKAILARAHSASSQGSTTKPCKNKSTR